MNKLLIILLLFPLSCFAGWNTPGPQGIQGPPGQNAQDRSIINAAIQHHFSPLITKWQGSVAGATDTTGYGAAGLSIGKTVDTCCAGRVLLHGNAVTDGEYGAYGIGATFTWD